MKKMKIFTVRSGEVIEGVKVDSFKLSSVDVTIPAIMIGEEGRGRRLGVLPVQLLPDSYEEWKENGYTHIYAAKIGATKAGRPKLFQVESADTLEKCVCVLRTMIGYRGSNSHTGDLKAEYWVPGRVWRQDITDLIGEEKLRFTKEEAMIIAKKLDFTWDFVFERDAVFYPFPGEILSEGIIAQGDAGRMGSGEQLVAVMPANTVFRTGYSGRLYGAPSEHYYIYRDGELLAATLEERELTDIF